MNTDNLDKMLSYDDFADEVRKSAENYKTLKAKTNYLRLVKRREILRTGVKDITGIYDLPDTVEQISIIAKVINAVLFEICLHETLEKYGIKKADGKYALMSLGKLGGNELNYSSDVDLFIIYEASPENIEPSKKNYFELLSEATILFAQKATEVTDAGYIYRVDFRLRPDGNSSPLCRTLRDTQVYYETRGEAWERQMLIKLDFIAGSAELFGSFQKYITHYVYPSSFSTSPLVQIAKMKNAIERRDDAGSNVKLFSGGIRDIEFSAQALQLINGGRYPQLRTGNTLTAISELQKLSMLDVEEADTLTAAYVFYRRIEHYLQLMNDSQTHVIPSGGELLEKMSAYFEYESVAEFSSAIEVYRSAVAKIFRSIMQTEDSSDPYEILQGIKFKDTERAKRNYKYLKTGENIFGHKQFDSKEMSAFEVIEEKLLSELEASNSPDLMLENFVKVIRSVSFASIWYREFENEQIFGAFLKLCVSSQRAIDLIATDSACREMFLSGRVFVNDISKIFSELNTSQINLYLSAQFTLGLISASEASAVLCGYIDTKIASVSETLKEKYKFFIAGLGSYGCREMNFNSDVDLIAVVAGIENHPDVQDDFQKMLRETAGKLQFYKTDFRLRPEGKSGQLVWDNEAYKNYLHTRAATWEFQTLTKIRFISGDISLFDDFFNAASGVIGSLNKEAALKDITEMRKKIEKDYGSPSMELFNPKKSKGGMLEIEFPLQYLLLCDNEKFHNYAGQNTAYVIEKLSSDGVLKDIELLESYNFIQHIIYTVQNLFNVSSVSIPSSPEKIKIIAGDLGLSEQEFKDKIFSVIQFNKNFFSNNLS